MERIADRIALVTGAASGIGLAITDALVAAGARVAMIDWHADELERESTRLGDAVVAHHLDVTDRARWVTVKGWIEERLGPVEILVNNAGIGPTVGPLADMTPESFDRMISIKLTGTFNGIRSFAAEMRDRGEGHIVNTASIAGVATIEMLGAYTAAKFGVVGLSEVLRAEMAPFGVGVSVLCPGLVRTNLGRNTAGNDVGDDSKAMAGGLDPAVVGRQVIAAIRRNDLFVITHPKLRPIVAERVQRLLAAFDPVVDSSNS